jgi:hypothetical protein
MSAVTLLVSAGIWAATLHLALAQATTRVDVPTTFPQGSNRSSTQFTSDPERWRPVAYSDLKIPVGEGEAYASIWQDRLSESNAKSRNLPPGLPAPNMSYGFFNRDAAEWHFSIQFQSKLVALSVLYTPNVCTDEYPSPSPAARIFVCPMRVATFRDGQYSILDGAACYLVKTGAGPAEDSTATTVQASYDVNLRAFKIRYTVSHTDIAQCDQTIPLHPI